MYSKFAYFIQELFFITLLTTLSQKKNFLNSFHYIPLSSPPPSSLVFKIEFTINFLYTDTFYRFSQRRTDAERKTKKC
ncbi:MAG: hypothetical protein ACI8RA_001965, partial [Chlamydiales bacterium]